MSQDHHSKEDAPKKASRPGASSEPHELERALDEKREADELERKMARILSIGIPVVSLVGFGTVSVMTNLSLGLLVLAGGAMLGTISLFWSSVRTLGGDAPLPEGLAARVFANEVDALEEEKRATLRILKDLEHERSVGKIDDVDYAELVKHYRATAMGLMQALDERGEMFSGDVKKHLANLFPKEALALLVGEEATVDLVPAEGETQSNPKATESEAPPVTAGPAADRVDCSSCKTANERDAVFCKSCGAKMEASPTSYKTGGAA